MERHYVRYFHLINYEKFMYYRQTINDIHSNIKKKLTKFPSGKIYLAPSNLIYKQYLKEWCRRVNQQCKIDVTHKKTL